MRRLLVIVLAAGVLGAGIGLLLALADDGPRTAAAEDEIPDQASSTTEGSQQGPDTAGSGLEFSIDPGISPAATTVAPLEEGGAARPVGRLVYPDGEEVDLVVGELIVTTGSAEELDGFLARHDGTLLESTPGEKGGPSDHLVGVPLTSVDAEEAARALVELEPDHAGELVASDEWLVSMMHIAATEKLDHGIDVALNLLTRPGGIIDGNVQEAPDRNGPFEWTYMRVGGPVDTGVTGAWQLIEHHGKTGNKVRIAIADGGFFENDDFPDTRKIRLDGWNEKNPGSCGGGPDDCPWHGTDVTLTAMAAIDNDFGTAGVAGQVGELIAIQPPHTDFWSQIRKIKRVVDEERPHVVNMSFSMVVKSFRAASESSMDRHLEAMKKDGALVVASAGNDGDDVDGQVCIAGNCFENRLVIPCESRYAMCVGGTKSNDAWLHSGSNHGTAGGTRSTEIYAPFCVVTLFNPVSQTIDDSDTTCGTSFSSPFVAGAAALVKAADPSLGPDQIRSILRETANVGGVHFDHYIPIEHQLRVNVMDAVAEALGITQSAPEVEILSPADDAEVGVTDWVELDGVAVDFKGQPLPMVWESSIDGEIGAGLGESTVWELTPGEHTITARAVDTNGKEGSATVTLQVVDLPPVMGISWPAPGSFVYETGKLTLIGSSEDPDTYQSLDDDEVEWEIVRNDQVVFGDTGHSVAVPANTLSPGTHEVLFRGSQQGVVGETGIQIHVLEVIGELPVAVITTEFDDEPYDAFNGTPVELTLTGFGTDGEDGVLSGTRFRWIARADNDHEEILCTGSAFNEIEPPDDGFDPGFKVTPPAGPSPPPVIGIINDCGTVDAELGLAPGAVGSTVWAIVLEVSDSDNQVGRDVGELEIVFVTG